MRLSKMRLSQRLSKIQSRHDSSTQDRSQITPSRATASPWFDNIAVFPDGSVVWNPQCCPFLEESDRSPLPIPEIIQPELLSLQSEFVPIFIPFESPDYKVTVTVDFNEV